MEVTLKRDMFPAAAPLPLYASTPIGTAENRDGERFVLHIGLDETTARQLKQLSLNTADTALMEHTSDFKRFGEGSYEEWYAKERVPFALIHEKTGQLAALVWFGPKPLGRKSLKHLSPEELLKEGAQVSGDWHTIVFRSYPPFRGAGLMKDFVRTATDVYLHYFPNAKLWAGISTSNPASIALAEKLGYTKDESISDPSWAGMVRS